MGGDMSIPAGVDGHAPVRARHETHINAPLDTVWRLHTHVNAWPAWQTEITSAHIDGAFQPGSSFEWTSYGFPVVSTIYAVAEHNRVLWGGTAGGITGVHEWVLTETPTGVHVTTEESFAGEPVEADVTGMQSTLDSSLISWLAHLKAAAESRG
jgi:Polyketide cyclase / dehydrase and lipid transport